MLIDFHFTDPKNLKQFRCDQCSVHVKKQRKCQGAGLDNLIGTKQVDEFGIKVNFCPGKATWYEEIMVLYNQCYVALKTGIMPLSGSLENQPVNFAETFSFFIEHWELRSKIRLWSDINEFASKIFEIIGKMFGGK